MIKKTLFFTAAAAMVVLLGWQIRHSEQNHDPNVIPLLGIEYDEQQRVREVTLPGGQKRQFTYLRDPENPNRLQKIEQQTAAQKTVLHLDTLERPIMMTDQQGETRFAFDSLNHLASVRQPHRPVVEYNHNELDELQEIRVGGKMLMGYERDFLGRVIAMHTPIGTIKYQYVSQPAKVQRTLPNGIVSLWEYEADGTLAALSHAKDGRIICGWEYQYRADKLLTQVKEFNNRRGLREITINYDEMQRLASVRTSDGQSQLYRYDLVGNRISETNNGKELTSNFNAFGQITEHAGKPCAFNSAGNLSADGSKTIDHFPDNKLKSVSNNDQLTQYAYFGTGMPASRTSGSKSTYFTNDLLRNDIWRPLAATDSIGVNTQLFIWQGDAPLAIIENGQPRFFLEDYMNSVRAVIGSSGSAEQFLDYSPFGVPNSNTSVDGLFPGFGGMFYDPSAGVYLTSNRCYDPGLGRFWEIDPIHLVPTGTTKDLGLYNYCGADPVNYSDLQGSQSISNHINWLRDFTSAFCSTALDGTYAKQQYAKWSQNLDCQGHHFGAQLMDRFIGLGWGKSASPRQAQSALVRDGLAFFFPQAKAVQFGTGALRFFDIQQNVKDRDWTSLAANSVVATVSHLKLAEKLRHAAVGNFLNANWLVKTKFVPTKTTWELNKYTVQTGSRSFVYKNLEQVVHYEKRRIITDPVKFSRYEAAFIRQKNLGLVWEGATKLEEINKLGEGVYESIVKKYDLPGCPSCATSNPGGIALKLAESALNSLGDISGMVADENGRLILLSDKNSQIELPPLRLTDVAAVAKAVYEGSCPFVSIDPDPSDPEGPIMSIRSDPMTQGTFVGFILFDCDRIMKCWGGGFDNISGIKINSSLPGYSEILEQNYWGVGQNKSWERFWIVPDTLHKIQSNDGRMTSFNVSLKIKTEKMDWKNGKLETAKDPTPSPAAKAFAEWFSKNMNAVGEENLSVPPKGSPLEQPFNAFLELRRLALLTAIFQNMASQNIPLPAWLDEFEVPSVEMPTHTPSLNVVARRDTREVKLLGGADLGAPEVILVKNTGRPMSSEAVKTIRQQPDCKPFHMSLEGKDYEAVALPGNQTLAIGAFKLSESDLVVPVAGDFHLSLNRHFSSFAGPQKDFLGNAWTLGLPRLATYKNRVKSTEKETNLELNHRLIFPTGEAVDAGKIYLVKDKRLCESCELRTMYAPNGEKLIFTDEGTLLAIENGAFLSVYRPGKDGALQRIEGWNGSKFIAEIDVELDETGRITKATGSTGDQVLYAYEGNLLKRVALPSGNDWAYEYLDGKVVKVKYNDQTIQEIEYQPDGKILKTKIPGWLEEQNLMVRQTETGAHVLSKSGNDVNNIEFDAQMRPIRQIAPDRTTTAWNYGTNGGFEQKTIEANGRTHRLIESEDGLHTSYIEPHGEVLTATRDAFGRPVSLARNGKVVSEQQWYPNGLLKSERQGRQLIEYQYAADEVLERIVFKDANSKNKADWLEIQVDAWGHPRRIKDNTGLDLQLGYDEQGNLTQQYLTNYALTEMKQPTPDSLILATSWGGQMSVRFLSENRVRISTGKGLEIATVEIENAKLVQQTNVDGSTMRYQYEGDNLKNIVAPNTLSFEFNYDKEQNLASVDFDKVQLKYSKKSDGAMFVYFSRK